MFPVTTFDIRNTNRAMPEKASPLVLRFGSNSGRRTINGSSSNRTRKKLPTVNSQM